APWSAMSAVGHERLFATALRHARMTLVSGPHHERLIGPQSNTSAILPIPTANKDRPRRLLCAKSRLEHLQQVASCPTRSLRQLGGAAWGVRSGRAPSPS